MQPKKLITTNPYFSLNILIPLNTRLFFLIFFIFKCRQVFKFPMGGKIPHKLVGFSEISPP